MNKKLIALKTIPNIVNKDTIFDINLYKSRFPFVDFNNKEYFKEHIETKFKVGDLVRYTGSTYRNNLSNKFDYIISDVSTSTYGCSTSVYYTLIHSESKMTIPNVSEKYLIKAIQKWIVSFSQSKYEKKPCVHKLTSYAYENKIKNSWKDYFTFDTEEEATNIAMMFARYTPKMMYEKLMRNNYE